MTTSGGGALLTDDADFAQHVRYLATQARQPVVHYEHTDIGYNYRMSNLLAAMGRAQLSRLDEMMARRFEIRGGYGAFADQITGVKVFGEPSGQPESPTHDNWWLTSILVDDAVANVSASALIGSLSKQNIEARPLWKPMHLQPVFADNRTFINGMSESLFSKRISMPSGSSLDAIQTRRIYSELRIILSGGK